MTDDKLKAEFSPERAPATDYLPAPPEARRPPRRPRPGDGEGSLEERLEHLLTFLEGHAMVVQPWQVASVVTALRTKPMVTLAGISGTGKSRLPYLLAKSTDSEFDQQPVSPEWTDSEDLLGFTELSGDFIPGPLLKFARQSHDIPTRPHIFMLDELNLARPEYYLAEILSAVETRDRSGDGQITSLPLCPRAGTDTSGHNWSRITFPPNLLIMASVNMDETTFALSRKLLDRMFVLEFSDVDLSAIGELEEVVSWEWPAKLLSPAFLSLAEVGEVPHVAHEAIRILSEANDHLEPLQLHVGYRVRDEVSLFCMYAQDCRSFFVDTSGEEVDPLDVALFSKLLPRLQGSEATLGEALGQLLDWASGGNELERPLEQCEARLQLMTERLASQGFASFWI